MRTTFKLRGFALLFVFALLAGACAADDTSSSSATDAADPTDAMADEPTDAMADEPTDAMADEPTDAMADEPTDAMADEGDSSTICDTDALVEAVEGGTEEGTLAGMADDPVGTAASNNPVLTTLTATLTAAGLVDTLNSAPALTVFAPTDCAFAGLDPATLDAAMADPSGLLTTVLGYHVIAGERIDSADLDGEYTSFTDETLTVDGTTVSGQAEIVVPDIQTANATVHLIDTVMIPPSVSGEGASEGDAMSSSEEPTEG